MFKWNPYPKVQPKKVCKTYLVTYRTMSRHLAVMPDVFHKGRICQDSEGNLYGTEDWQFGADVVAWAELPEPYKAKK